MDVNMNDKTSMNESSSEGVQNDNQTSGECTKELCKKEERTLCPICFRPYKMISYLCKHMEKWHPDSAYVFAQPWKSRSEETHLENQQGASCKSTSVEKANVFFDKENVYPVEEGSLEAEIPVDRDLKRNFGECNRLNNASRSEESLADVEQVSNCQKAVALQSSDCETKTNGAKPIPPNNTFVRGSRTVSHFGRSKSEGFCTKLETRKQTKTIKKQLKTSVGNEDVWSCLAHNPLWENFAYLYVSGVCNELLELARSSSNCIDTESYAATNSVCIPEILEVPNPKPVYVPPFLEDNGISSLDLSLKFVRKASRKRRNPGQVPPIQTPISSEDQEFLRLKDIFSGLTVFPFLWNANQIGASLTNPTL